MPDQTRLSPTPKERDPYLDNAKAVLIVLVVVGHLLAVVQGSGLAETVYNWIYSFHMPAFVIVTGYLSRSYRGTPGQISNLISSILVPYLVFQVIVRLEPWFLFGEPLHMNLFVPAWSSWFLLALFAWRLLVPVLQRLRFPVLWSVLIALASVLAGGIDQGLSGARIISYLPFFALGLALTPENLERFQRVAAALGVRLLAGGYLLAVGVLIYLLGDRLSSSLFAMSGLGAIPGDLSSTQHVLLRIVILAFTTSMSIAVLILVPQRKTFFTRLGAVTLTIYLLQSATLLIPRHFLGQWGGWSTQTVIVLMLAGLLFAFVLGSRPVQYITRPLVDPIGSFAWLRRLVLGRDEAKEQRRSRRTG